MVASATGLSVAALEDDRAAVEDEPPRRLLCARCRRPITLTSARLLVDGSFAHERTNPAGFTHRFGCFSSAPGCVSRGVPSRQATWFAGYFWQVQECGGCGEHLGWLFFATERDFYGLILDLLVEEPGPLPNL